MDKKLYELTNPQKNILSMEKFYGNTSLNTNCGVANINQVVDFEKLSKSIKLLVKNNPIFRLKFKEINNTTQQFFDDVAQDYIAKIVDVENKKELQILENKLSHTALFNSKKLFNFTIYRLPNNHGGVIGIVHHILSDSWGVRLNV